MTVKELFDYYTSARNIGAQLGFAANTALGWKKKGYIPIRAQHRVELHSKGRFKASMKHIPAEAAWPRHRELKK